MTNFPTMSSEVSSVTGFGENGQVVMEKIQDKTVKLLEETGREGKFVVMDSQSYLDLSAYNQEHTIFSHRQNRNPTSIYTVAGELEIIVLPILTPRIYVVGDPMFTAVNKVAQGRR